MHNRSLSTSVLSSVFLQDFHTWTPPLLCHSVHLQKMSCEWLECKTLSTSCVLFGGTLIGRVALNWAKKGYENSKPVETSRRLDRTLIRKKISEKNIPTDVDTVIIGSGMGGLSCAAVLARLGHKVLVLEQHEDVAGGGTHQFDLSGYRFDSGLHYTVPWSVPIFALTCLKSPHEVTPFDLMGDKDDVVDKIYLHQTGNTSAGIAQPFNMKLHEKHLAQLYADFPNEKKALDEFMVISDRAMLFVKYFLFARLLPQWMQTLYWKLIVPKSLIAVASQTAKEILPKLTSDKKLISLLSSMWIDTGARPDVASFMMTAAVFRGVAMEGGCYPRLGSEDLAIELARTINQHGGSILIRAPVQEIVVENGRATGVRVNVGNTGTSTYIPARRVVSGAGYVNTFKQLVKADVLQKYNIPKQLEVPQSAGFVMANIGISGSPEELGVTNTNTWHIPVDAQNDAFPALEEYFAHPLDTKGGFKGIPAFITFPGVKDKEWSKSHPEKTSCQMLMMAEHQWFREAAAKLQQEAQQAQGKQGGAPVRSEAYAALKEQWKERALEILFMYFPKARGRVEVSDISTPQTIEHWLSAEDGGAVGIDVTPQRFTDSAILKQLDVVTPIPGLYMTGQDTVLCGVTLCQLAGVITAFRMEGFCAAVNIVGQSVWRDIRASMFA